MTSLISVDIITIVTSKSNELLKEIHTLSLNLYADYPDNSVSQGATRRQHRDDRELAVAGAHVNNAGEERFFCGVMVLRPKAKATETELMAIGWRSFKPSTRVVSLAGGTRINASGFSIKMLINN